MHFHLPYWPTRSTLDFRNYRRNTNCPLFCIHPVVIKFPPPVLCGDTVVGFLCGYGTLFVVEHSVAEENYFSWDIVFYCSGTFGWKTWMEGNICSTAQLLKLPARLADSFPIYIRPNAALSACHYLQSRNLCIYVCTLVKYQAMFVRVIATMTDP